MDLSIEEILSELVIRVQKHFNISSLEAVETVALSKLGNYLSEHGNPAGLSLDQLTKQLYTDITIGE